MDPCTIRNKSGGHLQKPPEFLRPVAITFQSISRPPKQMNGRVPRLIGTQLCSGFTQKAFCWRGIARTLRSSVVRPASFFDLITTFRKKSLVIN